MSQALHVFLTEADRSHLDNLIKKGICSARVQNRARILLLADRGMFGDGKERTRQQISEATLTCLPSVCRICRLYEVVPFVKTVSGCLLSSSSLCFGVAAVDLGGCLVIQRLVRTPRVIERQVTPQSLARLP